VALSGPTLFAPLLQQATAIAASANCSQQNQKYSVLLILTDGIINDMEATIAAVVAASNQPLSIIIVGVGNEDFSCELNELLLFSS
jgi:Mg-chelatase subunit ChlD